VSGPQTDGLPAKGRSRDRRTARGRGRPVLAVPLIFATACLVALPERGLADDDNDQVLNRLEKAVERDRAKAQALDLQSQLIKKNIRELQAQLVTAAGRAQDFEDELTSIEGTLQELEQQEQTKLEALQGRRQQLSRTLTALHRIAMRPAEALIVSPADPLDTVRSAMLLRVAVPAIEQRAETLRDELAELRAVREKISAQTKELSVSNAALLVERQRISSFIDEMSALQSRAESERNEVAERAARLSSQAHDLRELVERVEREAQERERLIAEAQRQAEEARQRAEEAKRREEELAAVARSEAEEAKRREEALAATEQERAAQEAQAMATALVRPGNIRPFPARPKGDLLIPARGNVVVEYGQVASVGGAAPESARGITIETRPGAQVVAPFDGKVAYAGTFRQYGRILIIDHGERYHTLLAGLDRIDAVAGQWVLAGEPLATMENERSGNPELYFELRRTGQPIDPLPWLASTGDRVRG